MAYLVSVGLRKSLRNNIFHIDPIADAQAGMDYHLGDRRTRPATGRRPMAMPGSAGMLPAYASVDDTAHRALVEDAADLIREKLDVLLDRAVDKILGSPQPGSVAWRAAWRDRDTAAGRAAEHRRLLTRIAVAQRAGIDPAPYRVTALAAGVPQHELSRSRRTPRRHSGRADQLTIF